MDAIPRKIIKPKGYRPRLQPGIRRAHEIRRSESISPFVNPQYERKASGYWIVNGQEVAATIQCCHCGNHYVSVRGSGIRRGFCMSCMRPTCGKGKCDPCVPFMKKVEMVERNSRLRAILL